MGLQEDMTQRDFAIAPATSCEPYGLAGYGSFRALTGRMIDEEARRANAGLWMAGRGTTRGHASGTR